LVQLNEVRETVGLSLRMHLTLFDKESTKSLIPPVSASFLEGLVQRMSQLLHRV